MAIAAIISCLICIYMVFYFGRKVSETTFARPELVENAKKTEYQKLLSDLQARVNKEPIDEKQNPLPPGYGPVAPFWNGSGYAERLSDMEQQSDQFNPQDYYTDVPEGKTREQVLDELNANRKAQRAKEINDTREKWYRFLMWEAKEKELMEDEKKKCDTKAFETANNRIPKSLDISLLGGGFTFLLEFSTVIVIIFSLVVLGVLIILKGENIATILAAIAGYVLGKAGQAGTGQAGSKAWLEVAYVSS